MNYDTMNDITSLDSIFRISTVPMRVSQVSAYLAPIDGTALDVSEVGNNFLQESAPRDHLLLDRFLRREALFSFVDAVEEASRILAAGKINHKITVVG